MQIIRITVVAILLSVITQISAEPTVIFDQGGVSTETYRQILQPPTKVPDFGGQWVQTYSPLIQRNPENLSLWLPLSTSRLTPKRLADGYEKEVHFADLDAPICIIGSDELSLHWIKLHLDNLARLKARCWLVQADDFDAFRTVSTLLQGRVLMTPADGDMIADFFGIRHYPVFIDQRYISQ